MKDGKSICELIRESDPVMEEAEGFTEQYYGVTDDYYEWESITENFPTFDIYSTIRLKPFDWFDSLVYRVMVYHGNHSKQPVSEWDVDRLWNGYSKILNITSTITKGINKVINTVRKLFPNDNDKYVFFECFKECKSFMFRTVGIYDYNPIEAKSYKFDSAENLVEFINDNKDRLAIYYCKQGRYLDVETFQMKDRLHLRCVVLER